MYKSYEDRCTINFHIRESNHLFVTDNEELKFSQSTKKMWIYFFIQLNNIIINTYYNYHYICIYYIMLLLFQAKGFLKQQMQ